MAYARGRCRSEGIRRRTIVLASITVVFVTGSCGRGRPQATGPSAAVLRVGWSQGTATNPFLGLRQVSVLLTVEGLARAGEDGRMLPTMAEGWTMGNDGRSLMVKLRPNTKFHDGSPVDADVVAHMLPDAMRAYMGSVFSDVDHVRPVGRDVVEVSFHASSPFLTEAMESVIQKPGGIGTGPYVAAVKGTNVMEANRDYYLGSPSVQRVRVEAYPTIRTAWAEMLRGDLDMLYEVGPDALASMQNSSSVSVFTFTRRYQYVVVLNPDAPALRSAEVRRALNMSVDRAEVVRNALNGYGVVSSGPVWPRYWALSAGLPKLEFDPARAAKVLGSKLRFSCLLTPGAPFERIALEVKRQLAAVGVEMIPEEVPINELNQRAEKRQYDAILTEVISGPTLLRPYLIWHSKTPLNWGQFGNASVDLALDRVRRASGDDDLRGAITGLQQAFMDDPPAIFLAWSVRARAVSKRFAVQTEEGRDILGTMRLWKPTTADAQANRN